jgi:predicted aldo/keto reductase-like oxidoreductase
MDYLGKHIPKLGFGLMRLPMQGSEVDIEQTKAMVDTFISAGFTYFDTAYVYLNGKSEEAAKTALVERYPREAFQLATKLPAWAAKNADEARQMFYTSLARTGAGYFDYYLLHNLGNDRTRYFDDYGLWDFTLELKAKGLIRHVGFSMHDKADAQEDILHTHPEMEFVQLQINYDDWDSPTVESAKCIEVAKKYGKPVIIMEPVKGGLLANPPMQAAEILKAANPAASLSSWAIRFAASLPGLITVLSGMSSIAQMEDNLATFQPFIPLGEDERAVIERAKAVLSSISRIPCTACNYCAKDCPQGIAIPGIFHAMNKHIIFGNLQSAKGTYQFETREGGTAGKCIACGQCEAACPQHIPIIRELKAAAAIME